MPRKKLPQPGIYPDIPFVLYNNSPEYKDYIRSHQLPALLKSAAHYRAHIENKRSETDAMKFGRAAHLWILQNGGDGQLIVGPKCSKGSNRWQYFEIKNYPKSCVTPDEMNTLDGMKAVFENNLYMKSLMNNARIENTVFWKDSIFKNIKCRARIDIMKDDILIVADYKTTEDASHDKFYWDSLRYGYDMQSAWYPRGMKAITDKDYRFIFIVQEKKPPYSIAIYLPEKSYRDDAQVKISRALYNYSEAKESKNWEQGYPEKIMGLRKP